MNNSESIAEPANSLPTVERIRAARVGLAAIAPFTSSVQRIMVHIEHVPTQDIEAVLEEIVSQGGNWEDDRSSYLRPAFGVTNTFHLWFHTNNGGIDLYAGWVYEGKPDTFAQAVLEWRAAHENTSVSDLITGTVATPATA